jgi:hypothetical protein
MARTAANTPTGWHAQAHGLWQEGRRTGAIHSVLAQLNAESGSKPAPLVIQLAYYVFLVGDPKAAAGFLERGLQDHPDHLEMLLNAGACWSRAGVHDRTVAMIQRYLQKGGTDPVAYDALANAHSRLGNLEAAQAAGETSLRMKDAATRPVTGWTLPSATLGAFAALPGKRDVIAFSLFGNQPRYLRGAIDNALAARAVYPGWRLRFHVDGSVPADVTAALVELGCGLVREPDGQTMRQRLGWRFKVASDPGVGRFLVRDVDSVVGMREAAAVAEWIASGRWFHVMRDWWTHTDLILAGMWGGVADVLPAMAPLLDSYRPRAAETPNVDQWFLRDEIWRYVRQSCLVHDRCYRLFDARPWPGPAPEGDIHVGQDVFATRRIGQEQRLAAWIARVPSLSSPVS